MYYSPWLQQYSGPPTSSKYGFVPLICILPFPHTHLSPSYPSPRRHQFFLHFSENILISYIRSGLPSLLLPFFLTFLLKFSLVCVFMFITHIPHMKVQTTCRSWLFPSPCGSWELMSGHELRTGASFTWWASSSALHLTSFHAFSYCYVHTLPWQAFSCSIWIWDAGLMASCHKYLDICCLKAATLSWLTYVA